MVASLASSPFWLLPRALDKCFSICCLDFVFRIMKLLLRTLLCSLIPVSGEVRWPLYIAKAGHSWVSSYLFKSSVCLDPSPPTLVNSLCVRRFVIVLQIPEGLFPFIFKFIRFLLYSSYWMIAVDLFVFKLTDSLAPFCY